MKYIVLAATLALLVSCREEVTLSVPEKSAIKGLASPIILDSKETTIYLNDYFTSNSGIDSVAVNEGNYLIDYANNILIIRQLGNASSLLNEVKVWVDGEPYSLIAKQKDEHDFTLTIPDKGYKKVQVKGEFNGWNANDGNMRRVGDSWSVTLTASRGSYQYCLVFDGKKEGLDPTNPHKVSNNAGGFNSLATVGQTTGQPPVLITQRQEGNKLTFLAENTAQELFVYWENYRLDDRFVKQRDSIVEVLIPQNAAALNRSSIRVWAYNQAGIANDLLVPLHNGKVISNPKLLTRQDKPTQIIYSLMVDRFVNGDSTNDFRINSAEVLPKADYFGGDLAGITKKIVAGYFQRLGVNTIWLSPLMQNPYDAWGQNVNPNTKFSGYHGYWPLYLTQVDKRFGTDADLHKLLAEAHKRNMNVIVDYVAHHVHIKSPIIKEHPDWITPLKLPDGTLNLERWDDHRLTTWFDEHLPTLDLSRREIAEPMSDSAVFWLKKFDLDGFRHDASKHVDLLFWRMLTRKIKTQIDRPVYQIGETYGSPELIGSYVSSGLLDAQFDFNVYDAAVGAFAGGGSMARLWSVLQQSLSVYGSHNLMGYITGNHDRVRFISHAGGAVSFDEDGKAAGWNRTVGVGDSVAYKKLALLQAFIFSIPGIPCIYYGDEYGQPGANDPDNRRWMQLSGYSSAEQSLLSKVEKLTSLRAKSLPLTYGDTKLLYVDDDVLVMARTYFGQIVVSVINNAIEPKTASVQLPEGYKNALLKSKFGSVAVSKTAAGWSFEMQGNSFDMLTNL
ncbi:MAG: hypothetical protein LBK47_06790 [Prevotellaceae bacterium]|jgi:glycosidase|nr:hypothetical protein [Prevotellaceae bacterium]